MAIDSSIIDPQALTEFARQALAIEEEQTSSLAGFLPTVHEDGYSVELKVEANAKPRPSSWRAFDAEPRTGGAPDRVTRLVKLQPVSEQEPVGELRQLIDYNAGSDKRVQSVLNAASRVVKNVHAAVVAARAAVLINARLDITQDDYRVSESFGRAAEHEVRAATSWTASGASPLQDLQLYADTYRATTGVAPGTILVSRRVFRVLAGSSDFATQLLNGGSRPAGLSEVQDVLLGQGLPPLEILDERNANGPLLPDGFLLLLPPRGPAVATSATALGATFWGTPLSAFDEDYGLASDERSGIYVGVEKQRSVPGGLFVVSDALALPALSNANLTLRAEVIFNG